tara:strand:- start:3224 stop:4153 length:930 start_codon:yes stop_codon:yes gene_type:complete
MNKKGCIFLISARKKLLKECLFLLNENYNSKFRYPILIFYHGKIYDDLKYRESIRSINSKVEYRFHKLKAKIPTNLKKKDLFWNLENNTYAKNFRGRIGYLHAITFKINFINYIQFSEFDYFMVIDDDSWFKGKIEIDLFKELDKNKGLFGTSHMWKNSTERARNTRVNLFNWTKSFIKDNEAEVKDKKLSESLNREEDNKLFHSLEWNSGNCNVFNRKMFDADSWKKFNKEFNKISGGYRYRWGDCEIFGIYTYIYLNPSIINFNLKEKGLYDSQLPDTQFVVSKKEEIIQKTKNYFKYILKFFLNKA